MSKPINLIFLLLVCAAVLVSGCTGRQSALGGNGVVIEEFSADPPDLYSGEPFQLKLMVRNAGPLDAKNVRFELSNTKTRSEGLEITCKPECRGVLERLLAPDPQAGTSGESVNCIWKCNAPENVPRNAEILFNPEVRVYYTYESSVVSSVTILSTEELRSLQSRGEPLPSETISLAEGPIRLRLQMRSPVRYTEGTGKVTFPLSIHIENVGGGVACYPDCMSTENWDKVFLELDQQSEMNLKDCDVGMFNEVGLWRGKSRTIVCDAEIPLFSEAGRRVDINILKKTIKIKASYEYFTDSVTSVRVRGY